MRSRFARRRLRHVASAKRTSVAAKAQVVGADEATSHPASSFSLNARSGASHQRVAKLQPGT